MVREAVGVGETLVLAQEMACKALGAAQQEVSFEVIQLPGKKVFGIFGGKLAKVKASVTISPAKLAAKYLHDVLTAYGLKNFSIESEETLNGVNLRVVGGNAKIAIGHRGDTLDAIQYLVGLVANDVCDSYYRVTINISDYRERREKVLVKLAENLASKVLRTKKPVELEPMTPYERKVIHMTVEKIDGVKSWSEGEDLQRHLIIDLDKSV